MSDVMMTSQVVNYPKTAHCMTQLVSVEDQEGGMLCHVTSSRQHFVYSITVIMIHYIVHFFCTVIDWKL